MEEVLDGLLLRTMAVDEVLAGAAEDDLARHGNLGILLEADGRLALIRVIEDDGNGGLGDTRLAALVDEVLDSPPSQPPQMIVCVCAVPYLQILRADSRHVGDAEDEAY